MLSVVICVYNTEKELLREALLSLRRERGGADTEICIVDDGSLADYSDLARQVGARLVKTENRGIFSARYTGAKMACGDYVAFVDSDDSVSFNYHLPMVEEAARTGADIVYNDWAFHTSTTRYFCADDSTVTGDISLRGDGCLCAFMGNRGREHAYFVLWNKIFRRELLLSAMSLAAADGQQAGLSPFNYGEDALISFYCHREARRISGVHTGYYFYRIHAEQSVAVTDREGLRSKIECMRAVFSAMKRGLTDRPDRDKLLSDLASWEGVMARSHFSYAKRGKYTDLYPLVRKAYGVDKLRTSRLSDGHFYRHVLLAGSFEEADAILAEIWRTGGPLTLSQKHLTPYRRRQIRLMQASGVCVTISRGGEIRLPPVGISPIIRFLHSPPIYKLGVLIFKKGSRIRAVLKGKI